MFLQVREIADCIRAPGMADQKQWKSTILRSVADKGDSALQIQKGLRKTAQFRTVGTMLSDGAESIVPVLS